MSMVEKNIPSKVWRLQDTSKKSVDSRWFFAGRTDTSLVSFFKNKIKEILI